MSKISLEGNVSGSGTLTISAPNTNSNFTLSLPTNTGTIITQNSTPAFASTIGVGGATAAASGAGITFPATQSASSNANTLDDYEEGTFTPTVISGITTVSGTPAYAGTYVKIGNMVTIRIAQTTGNITWVSGALFGGLPFLPDTTIGGAAAVTNGNPNISQSALLYRSGGGAGQVYLATAQATSNTSLVITGTYFV